MLLPHPRRRSAASAQSLAMKQENRDLQANMRTLVWLLGEEKGEKGAG